MRIFISMYLYQKTQKSFLVIMVPFIWQRTVIIQFTYIMLSWFETINQILQTHVSLSLFLLCSTGQIQYQTHTIVSLYCCQWIVLWTKESHTHRESEFSLRCQVHQRKSSSTHFRLSYLMCHVSKSSGIIISAHLLITNQNTAVPPNHHYNPIL